MYLNIGKHRPVTGPSDLLRECHGRIRHFIQVARTLAALTDAPESEIAEAARAVRRYFAEALPLHMADEEELVLPLLLAHTPALGAALSRMSAEHREHEGDLARLIECCRELEASPRRLPELREDLEQFSARLRDAFLQHLEAEERDIFPELERCLSHEARAELMAAMRARRQQQLPRGAAPQLSGAR